MPSARMPIPPATGLIFQNGISHPDLWLWDSWLVREAGEVHLYCLALSKADDKSTAVWPEDRNDHGFHVRHFVSANNGQTWTDKGGVAEAGRLADLSDTRNIWSGSVTALSSGRYLFAHTGISQPSPDRPFVQSLNANLTSGLGSKLGHQQSALSCASRDYEKIVAAGYYLGPEETLGSADGEDSGPILAWRDPYVFEDADGSIHMFHSAKLSPKIPAIGHAKLKVQGDNVSIDKLLPPLELPDADEYTQAEVPKIYHDAKRDLYYMLISACDRLYEGQPDKDVKKQHRLYKATSLCGPWVTYHKAGSLLPGLDGLFGGSVLDANFDTGDFTIVAPYTEMAAKHQQLSFAPLRRINIYEEPFEAAIISA